MLGGGGHRRPGNNVELRRLWGEYLEACAEERAASDAMRPVRDAFDAEVGLGEIPSLSDAERREWDRRWRGGWAKYGLDSLSRNGPSRTPSGALRRRRLSASA